MAYEQKLDLKPQEFKIIKAIVQKYLPNRKVWAYGSRVKCNAHQFSDLDIVVFAASAAEIVNSQEAFESSDLPFTVDILQWEDLPEDFKENIRAKYILLH